MWHIRKMLLMLCLHSLLNLRLLTNTAQSCYFLVLSCPSIPDSCIDSLDHTHSSDMHLPCSFLFKLLNIRKNVDFGLFQKLETLLCFSLKNWKFVYWILEFLLQNMEFKMSFVVKNEKSNITFAVLPFHQDTSTKLP